MNNLKINEVGVTTKKNTKPIIIGETIPPKIIPNLNQILFRGNKIFEFNNPRIKNIKLKITDQILMLFPLINGNSIRIWSVILSLIFFILGLLNSNILFPLNRIWFKFGIILGGIVSPIIMGLVFFLVVTPTSLILRLFKKDVLSLKKNDSMTYWIKKLDKKSKMKNQF